MTVRKLKSDDLEVVDLNLTIDQAVLLLEYEGGQEDYILITKFQDEEPYLDALTGVSGIRFIGASQVFEKLEKVKYSWFSKLQKKVTYTKNMMLFYYPKTGKIRFDKFSASSIESFEKLTPQKLEELETQKKAEDAQSAEVLASIETVVNEDGCVLSPKDRKQVLIIDDSKTIQKILKKIINSSCKMGVMDIASCPSEAKRIIEKHKPDLITLDIHMPEMNGVDFLKTYLDDLNIPVVMISSVSISEGPLVLEALSHGAQTYIQKPEMARINEVKDYIIEQLEQIALKPVTNKLREFTGVKKEFDHTDGLICIGSSTGGTQALQYILTSCPDEIPPIVITQHIPAVFSKALADRLNQLCNFTVKEASDGDVITKNTVYIAPGGKQFKLAKRGGKTYVEVNDDEPVNRFKPSVDYLFNSIVGLRDVNTVGIILTGMGKDGAKGLLDLRNMGSKTIAQDKSTSTVYGMPREAYEIGAVDQTTPLHEVVGRMIELFNKKTNKNAA
jgi:two-component system chemotaxis response regulator CheB